MEKLLKKTDGFIYEDNNPFHNGSLPCYYYKKEFGYAVFFKIKGSVFDFGVYDNHKRLITLFTNIDQSIDADWGEQFIASAIKNTTPSKLKFHRSKFRKFPAFELKEAVIMISKTYLK